MSRISESGHSDLFGVGPSRYPNGPGHRGIATSVAAAASMRPHVTALQQRIVDFLNARAAVGGTYLEICAGTNLGAPTVTGRLVELVEAGLVKIAKTTRATPSGRQARIYLHQDHAPKEPQP